MKPVVATLALLAPLIAAGSASGQFFPQGLLPPGLPAADPRSTIHAILENDSLARNTDRYYTNGLRFGFSSPEGALPAPFAALDAALAPLLGPAQSRWGLSVGQDIFTPRSRSRFPDPRDRPYAGYLYGQASLDRRTNATLDQFTLQLGVVGPSSLAHQVQDIAHDVLGNQRFRGWRYQLRDEPVFNLGAQRNWRIPIASFGNALGVDAIPNVGVALGTVAVYAQGGLRIRLGQGLDRDFGPPRIAPSIGDAPAPVGQGWGWYVFGGAGGRVVGRDIFLDGNTYRNSRSVTHEPAVGDLELGAAVFWRNVRVSYTHDWRTKEFTHQPKGFQFGSLSLSIAF